MEREDRIIQTEVALDISEEARKKLDEIKNLLYESSKRYIPIGPENEEELIKFLKLDGLEEESTREHSHCLKNE